MSNLTDVFADAARQRYEREIRALKAQIAEGRQIVMSLAPGSTHWEGCESHHRACAWLHATTPQRRR